MAGQLYYFVTSLPQLGGLASTPPMTGREMLQRLSDAGKAFQAVETVLIFSDLLQRQAVLSGETFEPELTVLTAAQARGEHPLPDQLAIEQKPVAHGVPADAIWQRYFRYAAATAGVTGNKLLAAWVAWEVALRNALVENRAKVLQLAPEDYLVATDLADDATDFSQILGEWSSAADPLEGARVLDKARWAWITQRDMRYTFTPEELVAYALKLMLQERWCRISRTEPDSPPARQAG